MTIFQYQPHGRAKAACVHVWGPVSALRGSRMAQVWPVVVRKPDGGAASPVYTRTTFDGAMTLARRIADDRRLPLESDATRDGSRGP